MLQKIYMLCTIWYLNCQLLEKNHSVYHFNKWGKFTKAIVNTFILPFFLKFYDVSNSFKC